MIVKNKIQFVAHLKNEANEMAREYMLSHPKVTISIGSGRYISRYVQSWTSIAEPLHIYEYTVIYRKYKNVR